ncbi:hypothetical protein YH65_05090 [Sulfurovum lithotrophicum]|uniref:Cytochrome c domain-containing protein n=1 Tax=Sulfurovum lithotrophicum TaxID=206403 RepID=A0A7U4M0Z1_9BACT|nr:hypothetical protein [Sulfurovum lithotrophicum]AKF24830.1 hypothetical protein YH65_05090 [Sulfurovum lithotrophicum]
MKNLFLPLLVIAILLYALYLSRFSTPKKKYVDTTVNPNYTMHVREHQHDHLEEELSRIDSTAYAKEYIITVINHGSSQLHFKKNEIMEGGFVSKEDAPKVACYVLELSGRECKEPHPKDAAMFYTSVCGGCHGDDGKGLGGSYPDLTRKPLLGIEKREEFLKSMLLTQ